MAGKVRLLRGGGDHYLFHGPGAEVLANAAAAALGALGEAHRNRSFDVELASAAVDFLRRCSHTRELAQRAYPLNPVKSEAEPLVEVE